MTEQAPVLPRLGVYKQNLIMDQLAGGVHENTDETSDDKVIPTVPAPRGDIKVRTSHRPDKQ
jgi:hypothetical protein